MRIEIPDFCLVLLVGASGSGKSHLARKIFAEDEVLSSDYFRKFITGDETDQSATEDAFECLYSIAQKRMDRRKLTVIDATNLNKWARAKALEFTRKNHCFCVAIALNIPESECQKNNADRPHKQFPKSVIRHQCEDFSRTLKSLKKENFRQVYVLNSAREIEELEITRVPLWTDKTNLHGPFDIIGDVHGCYNELCALLRKLGYEVNEAEFTAAHPESRTAVFLGDFCDRGPASVSVLRLVMNMVGQKRALCVPGNHDDKLSRYLDGKKVQVAHGLETTLAELNEEDNSFRKSIKEFLHMLVSHYLLDDGKLLVCHAGLPANMHGRSSKAVREFCLYGDPTGINDEYGLPVRNDWAQDYDGKALVAYGHCPEPESRIVNNTICLDTGCVFGGSLTAMRYPDREIISVPAQKEYYHSPEPLRKVMPDPVLDCQELLKRQRIETCLGVSVIRDEERALSALELMGRFAANPRWLIFLPPTMSPCETSSLPDYLEHPCEAFSYYHKHGLNRVICQEKHMGSRALAIICKDRDSAQKFFAAPDDECGVILTRTGRPFFTQAQETIKTELLEQINASLANSHFWDEYKTGWVILDCELMPWSYKAQALVSSQYAPYGMAGSNGLTKSLEILAKFSENWQDSTDNLAHDEQNLLQSLQTRLAARLDSIRTYNKVWQSYCHTVQNISDIRLAPFHILATSQKVWSDVGHDQHLAILEKHLGEMPCFTPTRNIVLDLENQNAFSKGTDFWVDLLASGGEGMVVKPLGFVAYQGNKLLQPAIKCRGKEYLRIIYGDNYTDNLDKFKQRNLVSKRKRALREFALGMESLERFVRGEPLRKVHECVFTILALESEPQDARL